MIAVLIAPWGSHVQFDDALQLSSLVATRSGLAPPNSAFPFRGYSGIAASLGCGAPDGLLDPEFNYEYVIALSDEFRFVHEPTAFLGADALTDHRWSTDCFVGREPRGPPADTANSPLPRGRISGHRLPWRRQNLLCESRCPAGQACMRIGVGPAAVWLARSGGRAPEPAREVTPGELMHHVIRSMYSSLADRGVLPLLDRTTRRGPGVLPSAVHPLISRSAT